MDSKTLPIHIQLSLSMVGIFLFFYTLVLAKSILYPLAFAFLLAIFLLPICKFFEQRNLPIWLAAMISLIIMLIGLGVFFSIIYANLISFSTDFLVMEKRFVEGLHLLQNNIEKEWNISNEKQLLWLQENLSGIMSQSSTLLENILSSMTVFFTDMILIPIYVFFMLLYRQVFKDFIHQILNFEHHEKAYSIKLQIQKVTQKYVMGLVTIICIVATLNLMGLWLIGIPHALFFGIFAAVLTIIPYIGIFIGSLLPIIYALIMTDSPYYPIAIFIWFQIVQFLEGNFITPRIIGSQLSINPFVALLVLLIGSTVWGIAGMILFIPLTAILKVFLDNIENLKPFGYLLGEGKKQKK